MIKSVNEYESDMAQIITHLRDGKSLSELSNAIGKENFGDAMDECIRQGFVKGCQVTATANGSFVFQSINPRPSYFGLKFVESAQ